MRVSIYCLSILFLFSCLDPIDLNTETEDRKVVVDGTFTDVLEEQVINLTYSTFVENQVISSVTGADVIVESENGEEIQFVETAPGEYTSMAKATRGNRYRMKAVLMTGRVLTSNYQNVPKSFPLDSIAISDSLTVYFDEDGKRRTFNAVHFQVFGSADNIEEDLLMRFDLETTYRVSEVVCSPFNPPSTCYIYNDERPQSIQLLNIDKSDRPISFNQYIYFRAIDFPFGEVYGLDVGLLSYNFEEYDYWKNLKALFDQNGDITDILPGRLLGNIESDTGDDVLGQFAVVGKSRSTKLVRNSDFSRHQNPFCGVAGIPPYPLPDECCNCLLFPNASYVKPDYWPQ
ncbi:MAG: DUF4249 domain-containing protein [Saprospiraceae bacterium]|nr:DUF4249 domain-containing protein [Saprospiraceae bacterium]